MLEVLEKGADAVNPLRQEVNGGLAWEEFATAQQSSLRVDFALAQCQNHRVKSVLIHSDGACEGNPGPGGWAAVLRYGDAEARISGGEMATTNNRMEIKGAIEALNKLTEPCEVEFFTDSEYLRNGITKWIFAWKRKNWKRGPHPVKNADLWRALDEARSRHQVTWKWVRGHNGDPMNELCDTLAVAEVKKLRQTHTKQALKDALAAFKAAHAEDAPAQTPPLFA